MKKSLLTLWLVLFSLSYMLAQRTISGTVTDDSGEPLIGANVVAKGTTIGTVTDLDGNYELTVPDNTTAIVVSYTGYGTQEIALTESNDYDIQLTEGLVLEAPVVTALGVERESREIGYAVTTVEGKELTQVRTDNVVRNLSGRVPGVRVNSASGTAGGGVNVQIRGINSFGGGGPLFVVDGVPISNSSFNGSRNDIIAGGADVGNRASDINPDDIESVSVLKGASAVNLYGQRGRDGVVLITTKKAKREGINVEINSSARFASPLVLPDYQNEYATGNFGQYDANSFVNGWGPKISDVEGQNFSQFPFDGEDAPLQAYPDNVKDFFDTGVTLINSAAISTRSDKGDIRLGYTNLNQTGIIPGNEFTRHNLSLNAGTSLSERLRARTVINYANSEGLNRPRQGSNSPNLTINQIYTIPRTVDVEALRNNVVDENGQVYSLNGNRTSNNPFYVLENNPFNNEVDRIFGSATVDYDLKKQDKGAFFESWTLTGRLGLDMFTETRRDITSKGTINAVNGNYTDRNIFRRELNTDIISRMTFNLTDKLEFNPLLGWNTNQIFNERTRVTGNDLIVPELYNPANAQAVANERFESLRRLHGVYADFGFNWDNYLFVNITARNDWSSTLPVDNNSYFYPGVSTSFIFTEAFGIGGDVLNFGKLRASWANVGNDVNPYRLDFLYTPLNDVFTQFVSNNTYPFGGNLAFAGPDILPAGQNLQPQNQETIEIGTELQFYDGRFGVDLTYYQTQTDRQILNLLTAQSTGFDARTVNAGTIQNSGLEALVTLVPIRKQNFDWTITATYTRNTQEVLDIPDEIEGTIGLTSGFSGLSLRAEEGESFGLYGNGWLRNVDGDIIINPETGLREQGDRTRLGNILPDYMFGINNRFIIGPVTINALIDGSMGGVVFSRTVSGLRGAGLAEETLDNREGIFIDEGVNEVTDADGNVTYVENETPVRSMQDFWTNYTNNSNAEAATFDGSWIKLREVTVSYSLPSKIFGDSGIRGISVGLEASNLWLIHSNVPHIDPEASFFGPSLVGGAANVEFWSVPTARSIGANVRINF